jgi:hypothetical protein
LEQVSRTTISATGVGIVGNTRLATAEQAGPPWNQRGGFCELSMWVDPTNRTDSFHTSLAAGAKLPAGWKLLKKKALIPTTHDRLRFGNQFALFARVSQSTRQTI